VVPAGELSPGEFDSEESVHLTGRQVSVHLEDANHFGAEGDSASIGVGKVDCDVKVRVHEIIIQTLVLQTPSALRGEFAFSFA